MPVSTVMASGRYRDRPAYDDVIQGESGIAGLFAERDGEPKLIPYVAVDKGAATLAANGILAAFVQRERTGAGVYVEIPMFEAMVSFNLVDHQYGTVFRPPLSGYGYPRLLSPFRKPHRTTDGFICMLAYTDQQWAAFWKLTSRPELGQDVRFARMAARSAHIGLIYEEAGKEMATRSTEEWLALFTAAEIPAGRINTLDDVRSDPHL